MADVFRLRHDDTARYLGAVDADTVVEIGDLLYESGGEVLPASTLPDQGDVAANQALLAVRFAGVAMQHSDVGDTQPVRVAADGIFEFACPAGTYEVGDLVGAHPTSGGDGLLNQAVQPVARPELALGYVAQRASTPVTAVKVRLLGRLAGVLQLLRLERRQASHFEALDGAKTLAAADPRIEVLDPAGAGRDVLLPPAAASAGVDFFIRNAADADEALTLKDAEENPVATVARNQTAYVFCDGTTWRALVGQHD
jgi:hypothetical protein